MADKKKDGKMDMKKMDGKMMPGKGDKKPDMKKK